MPSAPSWSSRRREPGEDDRAATGGRESLRRPGAEGRALGGGQLRPAACGRPRAASWAFTTALPTTGAGWWRSPELLGGDWPAGREGSRGAVRGCRGPIRWRAPIVGPARPVRAPRNADALFTDTIKRELHAMEDRPWPEFGDQGKPISAPKIARLLRPFGIRPRSVRIDTETAKGYRREWFTEAWRRYALEPLLKASHRHNPLPMRDCGNSKPSHRMQRVTGSNGRVSRSTGRV